ncbi:hypothetical protein B0O99DRAFT_680051 [Bisporella sp. PMI_857]|nr:hypothetical protein B0O99DRAFT_680051 [Bisporella sp. PMI_857]
MLQNTAQTPENSSIEDAVFLSQKTGKPNIRDTLRNWEFNNTSIGFVPPLALPRSSKDRAQDVQNSKEDAGGFQVAPGDEYETDLRVYHREDLLDVGPGRTFLRPGDLVELINANGHGQELAVYVREVESQSQFYTMSGKWIHRTSKNAKFYIPQFVEPHEFTELLPYLPSTAVPYKMQNILQPVAQSIPRDVGKPLIRKMLEFWYKADAVYEAASPNFDNAYELVASVEKFGYATLEEIAEIVFPKSIQRLEDGKFAKPALYALHRSLLGNDIGFRVQTRGTLRTGGQYEINPIMEVRAVNLVKQIVREHQEIQRAKSVGRRGSTSKLQLFASQAQRLIDSSRQNRGLTSHGIIGPSKFQAREGDLFRLGMPQESFTASGASSDLDPVNFGLHIIQFLESWAALDSLSLWSSYNSYGPTILRAVGRYDDVDLNKHTAWTFLQEIGIIPPWENRAAYDLRLPRTGRRLAKEPLPPINPLSSTSKGLEKKLHALERIRHDWQELPVYCIDDVTAHEIDDGISLEKTEDPNEVWIHVHVADPAARLLPYSEATSHAKRAISNVYLPERMVPMLNTSDVGNYLSLAPNRDCLTFSTKMNLTGDVLDFNIRPGRLRNVLYISPSVVSEVTVESVPNVPQITRIVGSEIPEFLPSRRMHASHELSDVHKAELCLLHTISKARAKQLTTKGGISNEGVTSPSNSISVSFKGAHWKSQPKLAKGCWSFTFPGDPSIKITSADVTLGPMPRSETSIVQTFMLLAGEVAARWCSARGIPIPFRVTQRNPDKISPAQYLAENVLPSRDADGNVDTAKIREYLQFLGPVQPSVTPGPHVAVGVDMMTKVTSPLRRFGDLLVHFQIEAALIEEARLGKSLVGSDREDYLPFTKAQVKAILPQLDTRERLISYGQRQSEKHWLCQFLIRAWKFNECELPPTMPFVVTDVDPKGYCLVGMLTTFNARVYCELPNWTTDEIAPGDQLEVQLVDIDAYDCRIDVRSIGRYKGVLHYTY